MEMLKGIANWFRRHSGESPFTVVGGAHGEKVLVDPATLAYLESVAPQPTQVALNSLLDRVHSVRVFNSGCHNDTLLGNDFMLEVSEPTDIASLRGALRIVDGHGGHCMCYGGPTLEMLSADRTRLALLGVHHGHAIRWNGWKDDAKLMDGRLLLEWLAERGVLEPLRNFRDAETRQRQRQHVWNRWVESMPAYLGGLPEEMWQTSHED
jgi:hypothetical protein